MLLVFADVENKPRGQVSYAVFRYEFFFRNPEFFGDGTNRIERLNRVYFSRKARKFQRNAESRFQALVFFDYRGKRQGKFATNRSERFAALQAIKRRSVGAFRFSEAYFEAVFAALYATFRNTKCARYRRLVPDDVFYKDFHAIFYS